MATSNKFNIIKLLYSELSKDQIKKIKQLLRATTGENMITAQKMDPIYLVFDRRQKLIGYCMISNYSPENHFKNDGVYLYNFITDTSLKKEKRCGRDLLKHVEMDLSGSNIINLDVENSNLHAFKFFITNGYKVVGKYEKLDLRDMNLHEISSSIRNLGLQDKIDELKQRRGIKDNDNDIVSLVEDTPNKKIVYISLSKKCC